VWASYGEQTNWTTNTPGIDMSRPLGVVVTFGHSFERAQV